MSLSDCLTEAFSAATSEGFDGAMTANKAIPTLLAFIVRLVIWALIGKFFWNNIFTKLFTVVKPVSSIWLLIGLYFAVAILF